jgi:hypothetical protein
MTSATGFDSGASAAPSDRKAGENQAQWLDVSWQILPLSVPDSPFVDPGTLFAAARGDVALDTLAEHLDGWFGKRGAVKAQQRLDDDVRRNGST